jgi:hypothetical protein
MRSFSQLEGTSRGVVEGDATHKGTVCLRLVDEKMRALFGGGGKWRGMQGGRETRR